MKTNRDLSVQPHPFCQQILKHAFVERLMHYYHFVNEQIAMGDKETVTSSEIAALIHTDDTLVRKDLASIGVRGLPRVGFNAREILEAIQDILGFDQHYGAVIIGVGHLGTALASYPGFRRYGMEVRGLFDTHPDRVGKFLNNLEILPMEKLEAVVREKDISLAIISVPLDQGQHAVDAAIAAGIDTLWNFAGASIRVPQHVMIRHEHISIGLAELSYCLKKRTELASER